MVPVFDIEAMKWTLPIAVGFFDGRKYYEFLKVSEECDVIWEFLKSIAKTHKGIRLYAHNAANYDNKLVLDCLTRHNQIVRFPAGLGKLVWADYNISFEDSYLLMGRGLSACCEAFGVERKLEWDHSGTTNIWEMGERLDSFRAYLKRDCISLSNALDSFSQVLLDKFNITPSSTLSLTAVKAFSKRFYPVEKIFPNDEHELYIRRATYGGRNEVYKRYGENINFYDVRRMFVSCYDVPIPIGKMRWTKPSIDHGVLAEVKVKVPDMLIGPLPHRYYGHLIFPVGEFQGLWDMRELRNAVRLGVDVSFIRQLDCEEDTVLKSFGITMGELSNTPNEELSRIWKIFGLRLSGKFGQHRVRTEIRHISELKDQTGYCPIDGQEIYHEIEVYSGGNRSPYIKPAVNMRIRAEARIRHLNYMLEAGSVYYCDTDSVYTDSKLPVGTVQGDLRLVDYAQRAYFIGCKFYGYINKMGLLKQKTSGFRDNELIEYDFQKLLEGEEITRLYHSMSNWREILKGSGVKLKDRPRTLRVPDFGNRITSGLETYPIKLPRKET